MDVAGGEGALVAAGVGEVGGVVGGEVVGAGEVFFGTHVEPVVGPGVEQGVDGCGVGNADGAGRKADDAIGVVGRLDAEVFAADAPQAEVAEGEFNGRVGLEFHAFMEAVEVEAANGCALGAVVGFFFGDGGDGGGLDGGYAEAAGGVAALGRPKGIAGVEQALNGFRGGGGPVKFVGVGEKGGGILGGGGEAGSGEHGVERRKELGVGKFHLGADARGELRKGAHVVEGQAHRGLAAVHEAAGNIFGRGSGVDSVGAADGGVFFCSGIVDQGNARAGVVAQGGAERVGQSGAGGSPGQVEPGGFGAGIGGIDVAPCAEAGGGEEDEGRGGPQENAFGFIHIMKKRGRCKYIATPGGN